MMYELGKGVAPDEQMAYAWYSVADLYGYPPAAEHKAAVRLRLTAAQIEEGDAQAETIMSSY
jgi:TPR repeat protein